MTETKRVLTITPDGTVTTHDTDLSLAWLQGQVGGWIEAVEFGPGLSAFINEEGKLKGLDFNPLATALWEIGLDAVGLTHIPGDFLVGPVVVCGDVDDEGETRGLTDQQINTLLDQAHLRNGKTPLLTFYPDDESFLASLQDTETPKEVNT